MPTRVRVVLVGGGNVSVWAHRAIRRWLGERADVTLVSPVAQHAFHGWTGEVVAGRLPVAATLTPLAETCPGARIVRGRVVSVDRAARTVLVTSAEGEAVRLPYDHLVVGTGSRERHEAVPGLAAFGHRLRAASGPAALLEHLAERLAEAERTHDAGRRAALLTVVVAGGGLAGVEVAAAMAQRLHSELSRRRALRGERGRVVLLHRGEQVGAELAADFPELGRRLDEDLLDLGVQAWVDSPLASVDATGVVLRNGMRITAATVVATIGNRATALPGLDDLMTDPSGRLVVDESCRVAPGVWAGGDAALVLDGQGGGCAPSVLWAVRHGTQIGRAIAREAYGLRVRPLRRRGPCRSAALGVGRGSAEWRGIPVTGWAAWLLRLMFFLRFAPSPRQGLRVAWWWLRLSPRPLPAPPVRPGSAQVLVGAGLRRVG